jgi:hypothetical protein
VSRIATHEGAGHVVAGIVEGRLTDGALVVDTVTRLGEAARGAVLVSGSHGGVYAAWCAARAGVRAALFNDAGVGCCAAGIGGLAWLDALGIAAATLSHASCRIGDGEDGFSRGVISHANAHAARHGVAAGQGARDAARRLRDATPGTAPIPDIREARKSIPGFGVTVVAMDSVSLVAPEDSESIICTGSHGGLLGGRPETAVRLHVAAAFYNDAGIGIDGAGISRLPHLDARGIAGLTVAAHSARIGDGMSTFADGIVTHLNETARALGAAAKLSAREAVARIAENLAGKHA